MGDEHDEIMAFCVEQRSRRRLSQTVEVKRTIYYLKLTNLFCRLQNFHCFVSACGELWMIPVSVVCLHFIHPIKQRHKKARRNLLCLLLTSAVEKLRLLGMELVAISYPIRKCKEPSSVTRNHGRYIQRTFRNIWFCSMSKMILINRVNAGFWQL